MSLNVYVYSERCRPKPRMAEMARLARQEWVKYLAPDQWDKMMERML